MSQNVPTEGFNAPPQGDQTIAGGAQNVPPQNMQPGFVQQPNVPPVQQTVQQPAPAQTDAGLSAAIAALTAALAPKEPQATVPNAEPNGTSLNDYDVASIEDPILKSMATVMQTVGAGLDMDRALGLAISEGRADLIDVNYLREKGGANSEQLITIAQGIVQAVEAKATQEQAAVHALAGGEAGWNASVAAFNTGAPQELRLVVAQMLDSGKANLRDAGAKMIVEYGKNSGRVPNAQPLVQSGAASAPQGQALSKEGFQDELRKLNPQSRQYNDMRNELFARRHLGRNLGL